MSNIPCKFPSIENHYKSVGDLLGKQVYASEKIDGSNFSVHVHLDKGEWKHQFRSKNQQVNEGEGGMFSQAIQLAKTILPKLIEICRERRQNLVFFFEFFGKGIQKHIDYTKHIEGFPSIDGKSLALIDICTAPLEEQSFWFSVDKNFEYAKQIGVIHPRTLVYEPLTLPDVENMLLETGIEGYVLRAQQDGRRLYNHFGELVQVKVKTNEYTAYEKRGTDKEIKPKSETPIEIIDFLVSRVNFGRLHSVYSHGHASLKKEMADMRFLPELVTLDIKAEDNSLWEKFDSELIQRTVSKMLPKVLKDFIMAESLK